MSGFSDGELHRLVSAARGDVAKVRQRLTRGEAELSKLNRAGELAGLVLERALTLRKLALGADLTRADKVKTLAPALFVVRAGLPAMLLLMVAVTGANIETIKASIRARVASQVSRESCFSRSERFQ